MKTRGAIMRKAPGAYEVVGLDLDEPWQGELMVKMVGSGLCHTDDHVATGDMPYGIYPVCGGHEGAGIVTQVGPHTGGWAEGDHVVFSFLPACGTCRWCAHGMQNLCDRGAGLLTGARLSDPTSYRMSLDGQPVGQMFGLATFSEYTTVDVDNAVKVPGDAPLGTVCLLGCGVGTGWGSAVKLRERVPGRHRDRHGCRRDRHERRARRGARGHGGNNLDTTLASIRALPTIAEAVGSQVEVLFDGGIRRGADVVKALALGARAVMIGRAYLWGLGAAGESGVKNVLEILRNGIDSAFARAGPRVGPRPGA